MPDTPDTSTSDINNIGNPSGAFMPPPAAPEVSSAPLRNTASPVPPVQGVVRQAAQDDGGLANKMQVSPAAQAPQSAHHAAFKNFFSQVFGSTTPVYGRDGNPVTDPNTGQVATRPKTVKDSAKTVLSAALASLASSLANQPQDMGGGQWVSNDNAARAAQAKIGQQYSGKGQIDAAQAQADQNRIRQYQTLDMNMKAHQQALHLNELQRLDATAQDDDISSRQAFHDAMLNEKQEDGTPYIDPDKRGWDEADITKQMKTDPSWHLTHSAVHSGYKMVMGPDGQMQREETYDIFNTGGNITVTQNLADHLGLPKELIGNPMSVFALSQRVSSAATTQSLTKTFDAIEKSQTDAGFKSGGISLPDFLKSYPGYNTPKKLESLKQYAMYADSLGALMAAAEKNGDRDVVMYLQSKGVKPTEWALKTARDAADNKLEGDKAPAPKAMVDAVIAEAKKLPADQRGAILSGINPNGMNVGELEKLKDKVLQSVQQNRTETDKLNKEKQAELEKTGGPALITAIGTGHVAPERISQILARKPALLEAVLAAYPDFDSAKASNYSTTYKDFTSGKTSVQLNAGGTALRHLAELHALNTSASHIPGTPSYTAYENKVDTLSTELAKFYGDATIPAIAAIKKTLMSNLPGSRNAAIRTQAKSMGDKLDAFEQQWQNAAPSQAYQAPMPGISLAAKQARHTLDPNYEVGAGQSVAPQTHSFSISAWQRANPNGDVNAAKAAAQQQGYAVTQ